MKSIKIAGVAALALVVAIIGTAVAQNQSQPVPSSPGGTSGPHGMMGYGNYGFMGPGMMGYGGSYGGMGPWMMGSGGSGQAMCGVMAGHIEGRLGYIKAELKITDAQEPLWNTYAAAARDNANTMVARCTTVMSQRGTSTVSLPDRLDQHEQLMAAQLDAVRAMNKALKPLYAALSDSQKQSADQLFWGPMGMM